MNEKPKVIRSLEPGGGAAREAEERRRVAEIAREIEELGVALDAQDRLARSGQAKRARSSSAHAGRRSAGGVEDQQRKFGAEGGLPTMRRRWWTPQDAFRNAVGKMKRLTGRQNARTGAAGRKATEEKAQAEEAERKAA